MAKKRKTIITNNREIYEKFSMLTFSSEVLLTGVKRMQVDRILKNVNKHSKILDSEIIGDYIVIKKYKPVNFNIYLR